MAPARVSSRSFLFLLAILSAVGGVCGARANVLADTSEDSIDLPQLVEGCSLSIVRKDSREVCLPAEACESLLLVCGRQETVVQKVADLVGRVEIRDAASALEYLRLFSSRSTFYLFQEKYAEVYPVPEGECTSFCLPPARWNELGLSDASAQSAGDAMFEVTRSVVRADGPAGESRLYSVTELVTATGQVRLLKQKLIPINKFDEVWLMFPGSL